MRLAMLVISLTITGCFEYFGVDGHSSNYLRHRRAVKGCQELITDNSGSLKSPGFPATYPNDIDCWTLIKVGEDKKVHLTFETVDLEFGKKCDLDYVEVRDGDQKNATVLGRMCQEKERKIFESTSHSLMVHFHSDYNVTGKGYLANFKAMMAPQGGCLWEPGQEGGTISSPGHPENYPSSSNCSLVVVAPENNTVAFEIETLEVELEANCSCDFLTISEGTSPNVRLLGRFCGFESEPMRVESTGREVRVRFQSDYFLEFSGFKLRYRFVRPVVDKVAPSFSVVPGKVSVPEGSSSVLPCDTLHPNASIRWLKGEVVLAEEAPMPGLRLLSNRSLWIKKMGPDLKGVYTCIAVWSHRQVATVVHVTMGEDGLPCVVEFQLRLSDSEFEEGESAHLDCQAEGALSWLKDGLPLKTGDRVTMLENGDVVVARVRVEDAGTYTCVVEGVNGCLGMATATLKVTPKVRIQDICGVSRVVRNLSQSEHGKIVKGSDALEGAYPWQAMLWRPGVEQFCGGSLLNKLWVVTAAHCIVNRLGKIIDWHVLRILLGKHKRDRGEETEEEFRVSGPSSLVVHPEYNGAIFDNDVALIRLDRTVRFSDRVLPLCLCERNVTESLLRLGQMGVVIGWGSLGKNGGFPKYLQEMRVPVVEQERCIASTNLMVTSNMFCAGNSEGVISDASHRDSGGPFQVMHGGRWHLVGVVSWGEGCGLMGKYGFYTRIPNQLDWIQSIIQS